MSEAASERAPIRAVRATAELDAELLRFTTSVGTGKGIQLVLDRSPSFFAAMEIEGEDPAVAAFLTPDPATGQDRVVGTGLMTEKRVHIGGSATPRWIGQLGSARIDPAHRRGHVFVRCFRLLHEWSQTRRARIFLTTILEDNLEARAIFESGRARIPTYRDLGRLVTLSYAIGRRDASHPWARGTATDVVVRPGTGADIEPIIDFWREHGPQRQFFPAYEGSHLQQDRGLLRGLGVADLLVARRKGDDAIVGTLGLWDQSPFRRWLVQSYPRSLAAVRPLWNAVARLRGGLLLPAAGSALDQRFVAALCVAADEPAIFRALLGAAWETVARGGGSWISLGLHEGDPLLAIARRASHRELHSRLYVVHWPEGKPEAEALDRERCPYVELGAL